VKKLQRDYTIGNVTYHRDILNIKDNGRKVVLCHYPIHEWDGYYNGAIHIHGHTHSNIGVSFREGAYDAGVDARNFEPVTLDEMINWS
jgi:calcineurin-like phosphoesterase family protein